MSFAGLRRDGHLTDLALEHLLDDDALPNTDAHLAGCAACSERLAAMRAEDQLTLPAFLPPSVVQEPVLPGPPANDALRWFSGLAVAAAVLIGALVALPGDTAGDGYRVKGAGITLQVFRDEGENSQRLRDGDTIAPGDRLGFRIRQRNDGHLMIIGVDQQDEPYLCFPQSRDGESVLQEAASEPRALPEAIRMDEARGSELLVAVLCDDPFDFDEMARAVLDDRIPSDCATDRVELIKP